MLFKKNLSHVILQMNDDDLAFQTLKVVLVPVSGKLLLDCEKLAGKVELGH